MDQLDPVDQLDHRHHSLVGAQCDRTPLDYISVQSAGNICIYSLNFCLFVHKYTNINKRLMLVKITSILTLEKFPEDWITALTCFVCLFVGLQIHKYTKLQVRC